MKREFFRITSIGVLLTLFYSTAFAQQVSGGVEDDPVARSMKSVEAVVNPRAEAAGRVVEASRLVNNGTEARKRGDRKAANESLKEAETVLSTGDKAHQSALIEALAQAISEERYALDPKSRPSATRTPSGSIFTAQLTGPVSTRMRANYETLGRILEQEQMPRELVALAMVESSFNPLALSPKGARGIWQFMPATAVRYGLTVQPGNDHRTHPEHSTRAAARYLRDLFEMFGDWKLAIAAYNAGEGRVQRIIDRTGIRDFDEMARRRLLPAETRNYVPAVLARWAQLNNSMQKGK
ncbi:MAG TPA: lytic transglycosylase domain-containing protein [Blastocatellia bacterium]|nr:lytic transglycosylase domain-containing protein [Blastocatellia bacterium]